MNDFPVDKSKKNQTPLWEKGKNSARETNQVRKKKKKKKKWGLELSHP